MKYANSESKDNTMNIQNAQTPSRLALKLSQRRRLSGESANRCRSGGTASPIGACAVVSGTVMVVRSSSSHLPGLEVDARINPGVGEVRQQVHQQPDQRQNVKRGEYYRVVAVEHALEAEQADAVEREYGLDQERAGKKRVHERAGEAGDHDQHGVAEDVPIEHLALGAALGARGEHVLLADLVEEGVLGQQRHGGECGKPHGEDRQHEMPEIVEDLSGHRQLRPIVGGQSAQREDIEERAAGEQNDEQNGEQESR